MLFAFSDQGYSQNATNFAIVQEWDVRMREYTSAKVLARILHVLQQT